MKKRRPRSVIVDLSIDFDFFSRECLSWDWGHSETEDRRHLFLHALWPHRYLFSKFDLKAETDIRTFADFMPAQLPYLLHQKNLTFVPAKVRRAVGFCSHLGVAESHEEAFSFFAGAFRAPDYLVNIDAHHDCFGGPKSTQKVTCGNWMTFLYDKWQEKTKFIQLYPKWKYAPECCGSTHSELGSSPEPPPNRPITMMPWEKWEGIKTDDGSVAYIRNIFICRSGVWLPPHHDGEFQAFVEILRRHFVSSAELLGPDILIRSVPSSAEIEESRRALAVMHTSSKATTHE